jgi:hypothetical protein
MSWRAIEMFASVWCTLFPYVYISIAVKLPFS